MCNVNVSEVSIITGVPRTSCCYLWKLFINRIREEKGRVQFQTRFSFAYKLRGANVYLNLCFIASTMKKLRSILICLSLISVVNSLLCSAVHVQPPSLLISLALSSPWYSSFPWFPWYFLCHQFSALFLFSSSLSHSWHWNRAFGLEKCQGCKSLLRVLRCSSSQGHYCLGMPQKTFYNQSWCQSSYANSVSVEDSSVHRGRAVCYLTTFKFCHEICNGARTSLMWLSIQPNDLTSSTAVEDS